MDSGKWTVRESLRDIFKVHIDFTQLTDKLVFANQFWECRNNTVGEPFMAPGGEMFRYPQHFGENALCHGSHEWLPYNVDEVRLRSQNTNNCPLSTVHCPLIKFPSPERSSQ